MIPTAHILLKTASFIVLSNICRLASSPLSAQFRLSFAKRSDSSSGGILYTTEAATHKSDFAPQWGARPAPVLEAGRLSCPRLLCLCPALLTSPAVSPNNRGSVSPLPQRLSGEVINRL